jgi:hypothetical protein
MPAQIDTAQVRSRLADFNFRNLFIDDLGWDHLSSAVDVKVDGRMFILAPIAQKRGMAVFHCASEGDEPIPDARMRRAIERQVARKIHEHLIIHTDGKRTIQTWQWVRRERGKPLACREHTYHVGQPGDSLIQKLLSFAFSLDEEEQLTLVDILGKVGKAFDVERVTKRFYDRFKTEHASFLKSISGITDEEMGRWYASVMLNRLMFIYFIQKKGFLEGDMDYLSHKLAGSRKEGRDLYYRSFLLVLFFQGLSMKLAERTQKTRQVLGDVPYLNGGIFLPHRIELELGKKIAIPDKAFERLFDFFDAYRWHLDERPLKNDNEINPDVLGYIFEKYINQKQMGAYYTKEDITEYIGKNTVIPFIFDAVKERCRVSFEGDDSLFIQLKVDPDRYIYPAVAKGIDLILPPDIAEGIKDVSKRTGWNKPAPDEYALPTEIWREVAARRARYDEVKKRLRNGEVGSINDLITYNLDIRQFAQDTVESCEGPELLSAFWHAVKGVTVLDPTCGSGAFLFAALNVLEPLYEACLERMQFFLDEWGEAGRKNHPNYFRTFTNILKLMRKHPNQRYFIFKSIIVNNLYGVDIMEEAVEICKLRLFLKLVAQIEHPQDIEPLPDIDFNIRSGNTLVGFVSLDEVKKTQSGTLGFSEKEVARIEEEAENADRAFQLFQHMQTEEGMSPDQFISAKEELRSKLKHLTDKLDVFLAQEYGVDTGKSGSFEKWVKSHQPFHWFAEFYGILKRSGFDVIIGNPPYGELRAVTNYQTQGYSTAVTKNLYPLIMERSFSFSRDGGQLGFIVPVSSISTEGYKTLQTVLLQHPLHISAYDDRPSRLFDGLEHIRLTIHLLQNSHNKEREYFSTECLRWSSLERSHLFSRIKYQKVHADFLSCTIPKLSSAQEFDLLSKVWMDRLTIGEQEDNTGKWIVYYSRKLSSFLQVLDFVPKVYDGNGKLRPPSELKELKFQTEAEALMVLCVLNSTLFRWFINVFSDFRHINKREVYEFHFDIKRALLNEKLNWLQLSRRLSASLSENSEFRKMAFAHDTLKVQCIVPKRSKSIIDEIDCILAKHYGFTDEELDFIINYDIKYRMGQESLEDGEE